MSARHLPSGSRLRSPHSQEPIPQQPCLAHPTSNACLWGNGADGLIPLSQRGGVQTLPCPHALPTGRENPNPAHALPSSSRTASERELSSEELSSREAMGKEAEVRKGSEAHWARPGALTQIPLTLHGASVSRDCWDSSST